MTSDERSRLDSSPDLGDPWRRWGPYLSARQWGTVREDYSADGDAWAWTTYEGAVRRANRWGDDGLAGWTDRWEHLCVGLALWNGKDPMIKERLFGLTNGEGNHGEDAKEYWWVLDDTPTHSWSRWLYRYPQAEFPYARLRAENAVRGRDQRELELADTGVLDDNRFFDVVVTYAKAAPDDVAMVVTVTNHGPDAAELHLLPQVWFRNTWAWGRDPRRPVLEVVRNTAGTEAVRATHTALGTYWMTADVSGPAGTPTLLVTDHESDDVTLYGAPANAGPWHTGGINDHIVHGLPTVNPDRAGTKAAFWWHIPSIPPGGIVSVRLSLAAAAPTDTTFGTTFDATLRARADDADAFYADVLPVSLDDERRRVARRALAGLLWGVKHYRYDVRYWLEGDPSQPPPPASRLLPTARNTSWEHLYAADLVSMPDEWEYPWFAAWDLAFHAVALALVDPALAKDQVGLLLRQWYMHPDGQLPAYEWAFGDVNPPVHAWAAWQVYETDAASSGKPDTEFLARVFGKLLLNFSWWVNRKDPDGSNLFEGGFLGMDNIGVFDRSTGVPAGHHLEQSDATSWMALYCLWLMRIALELSRQDPSYEDLAYKFVTHFLAIAEAATRFGRGEVSVWDEDEGFFYDVLHSDADGTSELVRVRSMVGLLPLLAVSSFGGWVTDLTDFSGYLDWLERRRPDEMAALLHRDTGEDEHLLALVGPDRLRRVLTRMLDESEFLSPYGIRSLSAAHRDGFELDVPGAGGFRIDYEPGESRTGLFGGNSNWRGPVWMPVNVLLVEALRVYDGFLGPAFTVEMPTGSGNEHTLGEVADEITRRLESLFLPGPTGSRPSDGARTEASPDLLWRGQLTFSEYFDGDTGEGLGASHQTGWTALVAVLMARRMGRQDPAAAPVPRPPDAPDAPAAPAT